MNATAPLRVLLLGAGGQLGRALRVALPRELPALALTALDRRDLDVTVASRVAAVVRDVAPGLVINAAAYTDVDRAEVEEPLARAVNAVAAGLVADAARAGGAPLVHYSTDYVFDGSGETPWPEDAPTGPLNAYGRTKLAGERAIRSSGADHLIVRTSWIYGHGGRNFVETMLRLGAERPRLAVVADQIGAPTSAEALATVTAEMVRAGGADLAGSFRAADGTVHVACGGATSWHGFAEEIFRQARRRGLPLEVSVVEAVDSETYGAPARRPRNSRLDCRRLAQRFGLRPPHWKQALARYLDERRSPPAANRG